MNIVDELKWRSSYHITKKKIKNSVVSFDSMSLKLHLYNSKKHQTEVTAARNLFFEIGHDFSPHIR